MNEKQKLNVILKYIYINYTIQQHQFFIYGVFYL